MRFGLNTRKYPGKDYAVVYTDGACSNNQGPNPKAGYGVFWGDNHPLNVAKRIKGRQTNNRAEIKAVTKAVEQAIQNDYNGVIVFTDSQFVVKAMTKWIYGWRQNGWRLYNGGPVKNRGDFEKLAKYSDQIDVIWVCKQHNHI